MSFYVIYILGYTNDKGESGAVNQNYSSAVSYIILRNMFRLQLKSNIKENNIQITEPIFFQLTDFHIIQTNLPFS